MPETSTAIAETTATSLGTTAASGTMGSLGAGLTDPLAASTLGGASAAGAPAPRGGGEDVSGLFEQKATPSEQFESDVELWHRTLTENGDLQGDELRVHQEQQDILTRNFIAMAMLGPEAGNQVTGEFQSIDSAVQQETPLAALASHGGRIGYESESSEVGERFKNQLLFGSNEAKTTEQGHKDPWATKGKTGMKKLAARHAPGTGTRDLDPAKRKGGIHGGLYQRSSSHNQTYDQASGHWHELKGKTKWKERNGIGKVGGEGKDTYVHSGLKGISTAADTNGKASLGMNFAMGGVGNTAGGRAIGSEGTVKDSNGTVLDHKQHGHAYFKHNSDAKGGARLMVGFEGSAPSQDSRFGAHDEESMNNGKGNARSLTGQSKGSELGMDFGLGGIKADVTEDKLEELEGVFAELQELRSEPELHSELIRELLEAKDAEQRKMAVFKIKNWKLMGLGL